MIKVNNLTVELNNCTLLKNISCTLIPQRITCFIGKSGAGKTTLLQAITNLITSQSGAITVNNRNLQKITDRERAQLIGYVFQDFNLFNNLTVLENCTDPLIVNGFTQPEAKKRSMEQLKLLDMSEFCNRYPSQLSGGQQQRVAIARALCLQPQALLLDEPTASLDPANTQILINILQKLAKEKLVIGVSSQDMSFIRKLFDRVYFLENGGILEFCDNRKNLSQTKKIKGFFYEYNIDCVYRNM